MEIHSIFTVLNSVKKESVVPIYEFDQHIQRLELKPEFYKGNLLVQEGALHNPCWDTIFKILREDVEEDQSYIKLSRHVKGECFFALRMRNGWMNNHIYVILHIKPILGGMKMNLFVFTCFNIFYKFIDIYTKNNLLLEDEVQSFLNKYVCDVGNYLDNFEFNVYVRE